MLDFHPIFSPSKFEQIFVSYFMRYFLITKHSFTFKCYTKTYRDIVTLTRHIFISEKKIYLQSALQYKKIENFLQISTSSVKENT